MVEVKTNFINSTDIVVGVVVLVMVCAFVYLLAVDLPRGKQRTELRREVCHPFSVLTRYELENKSYVVCGDKKHKVYWEENDDE